MSSFYSTGSIISRQQQIYISRVLQQVLQEFKAFDTISHFFVKSLRNSGHGLFSHHISPQLLLNGYRDKHTGYDEHNMSIVHPSESIAYTSMGLMQSRVSGDDSNTHLLTDPVSQSEDEEAGISGKILYRATFDELENDHVTYDTVLWVIISLLLILAWGVGILMLVYLPVRRYILRQDIRSRTLYVTSHAIVYKVRRPAFLPCLGYITMEKHVLLPLVTDVIIEQGCLQALYGIHTIRVENLAHGKPTSLDEFQIQGVVNPKHFQKVILAEASKFGKEAGSLGKSKAYNPDKDDTLIADLPLEKAQDVQRSQLSSLCVPCSTRFILPDTGSLRYSDTLLLHKLDEVERSIKKIEALVEHSQSSEKLPQLVSSLS